MEMLLRLIQETYTDYIEEAETEIAHIESLALTACEHIDYALTHIHCADSAQSAFEMVSLVGIEPAHEQLSRLFGACDTVTKIVGDFTHTLTLENLASERLKAAEQKVQEAYNIIEELTGEISLPLDIYVEKMPNWERLASGEPSVSDKETLTEALEYASRLAYVNTSQLDQLSGLADVVISAFGICSTYELADVATRAEHIPELIAEMTERM